VLIPFRDAGIPEFRTVPCHGGRRGRNIHRRRLYNEEERT